MKKRVVKWIVPLAALAVLAAVWGVFFARTNDLKYRPETAIYPAGETVEIGKNYFEAVTENPDGYSICVKGATLRDYRGYTESLGGTVDDKMYAAIGVDPPKYVYDVEIVLRNENNTEGLIHLYRYSLQDQSLTIPIDFELWGLLAPQIKGNAVFRLQPGTEETVHLPFVPEPRNGTVNEAKTERMMENDTFYLCVSHYPTRKLLEVAPVETE